MNIKPWIHASRLRTLPLAAAGMLLASFIAYAEGFFSWSIFGLAFITILMLQILSNWANDYGDFKHGTDNEYRVGPTRTLQSGALNAHTMKVAIIALSLITLISGLLTLFVALKQILSIKFILFFVIGILAIAASIKYTVGKSNYGYKGFGDIMVFIFFGLTAVWGTYFLFNQQVNWIVLLPAIAIGLLSAGVLNLNNMRDVENDKQQGKYTLAVKLGNRKSKIYHVTIIVLAVLLLMIFLYFKSTIWATLSLLLPSFLLIKHLFTVWMNQEASLLDPELKKLSLSTLLISLWTGIALLF